MSFNKSVAGLAPSEFFEVHDDVREVSLLEGQKRVLEMVATGAPLADTLDELLRFLEARQDGLRCGILIVAEDGGHFRRGPNLPEA